MRPTPWLYAWHTPLKGRTPQPVNKVPFQEILPLKLKNRVSGKSDKKKEGGCLYEMSLVVACLQDNEYENKRCQKEVDTFNNCYKKYLADRYHSKQAQQKGLLVPGEKNLTNKQVRKLLNQRPIPQ